MPGLPHIGGKSLLRERLGKLIPADIDCYVEVFGGGAWLLFSRERWASAEILNDIYNELTNFFKCVKFHGEETRRGLEGLPKSRSFFYEMKDFPGFTDIQRAIRFYFLVRTSFGGKGEHFGTATKDGGGLCGYGGLLQWVVAAQKRLDRVVIENLDFEECIGKYDRPGTFFFCDPPYTAGCKEVHRGFADYDHARLAGVLRKIRGRGLLTYDDTPLVRKLYGGFGIEKISHVRRINMGRNKGAPLKH